MCLKSNTLKHPDGVIFNYDMFSMYNEKEIRLSSVGLGGKLTYDMVNVFNELPNYFNVGDTTQVVFQNIKINTEGGIKPGKPLVVELSLILLIGFVISFSNYFYLINIGVRFFCVKYS